MEKREKNLLVIFFIILFIGILFWGRRFAPQLSSFLFPKVEISYPEIKKLRLNLEILESPKLKNLAPFPQVEPPKSEEVGKENPFLTSPLSTTSTLP